MPHLSLSLSLSLSADWILCLFISYYSHKPHLNSQIKSIQSEVYFRHNRTLTMLPDKFKENSKTLCCYFILIPLFILLFIEPFFLTKSLKFLVLSPLVTKLQKLCCYGFLFFIFFIYMFQCMRGIIKYYDFA